MIRSEYVDRARSLEADIAAREAKVVRRRRGSFWHQLLGYSRDLSAEPPRYDERLSALREERRSLEFVFAAGLIERTSTDVEAERPQWEARAKMAEMRFNTVEIALEENVRGQILRCFENGQTQDHRNRPGGRKNDRR